jgi:hypothetical protein
MVTVPPVPVPNMASSLMRDDSIVFTVMLQQAQPAFLSAEQVSMKGGNSDHLW